MYSKILVPLDGSKTAECTFGHVIDIARGCSVPEIDLLFAILTVRSFALAHASEQTLSVPFAPLK